MKTKTFAIALSVITITAAQFEYIEEKAAERQPRIWIDSAEFESEVPQQQATEKGQLHMRRLNKKKPSPIRINNGANKIRFQIQEEDEVDEESEPVVDLSEVQPLVEEYVPAPPTRFPERQQSDGMFVPPPYYIPPRNNVEVANKEDEDEYEYDETIAEILNLKKPEAVQPSKKPIIIARSPHMLS